MKWVPKTVQGEEPKVGTSFDCDSLQLPTTHCDSLRLAVPTTLQPTRCIGHAQCTAARGYWRFGGHQERHLQRSSAVASEEGSRGQGTYVHYVVHETSSQRSSLVLTILRRHLQPYNGLLRRCPSRHLPIRSQQGKTVKGRLPRASHNSI